MTEKIRCRWVTDDPLYLAYHDEEWGRPTHDAHRLFEMLNLERQQKRLKVYSAALASALFKA